VTKPARLVFSGMAGISLSYMLAVNNALVPNRILLIRQTRNRKLEIHTWTVSALTRCWPRVPLYWVRSARALEASSARLGQNSYSLFRHCQLVLRTDQALIFWSMDCGEFAISGSDQIHTRRRPIISMLQLMLCSFLESS
jgi:hypothetical protein